VDRLREEGAATFRYTLTASKGRSHQPLEQSQERHSIFNHKHPFIIHALSISLYPDIRYTGLVTGGFQRGVLDTNA
jgi:hypothetical protein